MTKQVFKCTTMRCCKFLLLVIWLVDSVAANDNGSASSSKTKSNNFLMPPNERTRRDVNAAGVSALSSSSTSQSSSPSATEPLTHTSAQQLAQPQDWGSNQNSNNNDINRINDNNANSDEDRHNLPFNIGNALRELNIVKRAPNGFNGVRGKKEYEFTDYSNSAAAGDAIGPNNFNALDWEIDPLRQTIWANEYNMPGDLRFKKAPSAFYGVRGKKYTGGDLNRIDGLLQRLESERLREAILEDFLNGIAARTETENEITKRAPTGFMGMRGKRPAMDLYDEALLEEKRGPVNAFVGVRGKKDVDHQTFKRSPADISNRRSKAQRFVDFSNKFVAVRGKKSDVETNTQNVYTAEPQYGLPPHEKFYANMQWLPILGGRNKRDTTAYESAVSGASSSLSSTNGKQIKI